MIICMFEVARIYNPCPEISQEVIFYPWRPDDDDVYK